MRPLTLTNRSASCAFLCYHSIAPAGPRFLSISAELFERQLAWLRRSGWQTGNSATLDDLLAGGRPKTPTAFLTFDDGYRDTHDAAFPLLQAYEAKAIVFVLPPALESGRLAWPEIEPHQARHSDVMRSMTWEMVDALSAAGIEIGSHGLSHRHFDRLGGDELREDSSHRDAPSPLASVPAERSPIRSATGGQPWSPPQPRPAMSSRSRCRAVGSGGPRGGQFRVCRSTTATRSDASL